MSGEAEFSASYEFGQPNGSGEIEDNNYREWFKDKWTTHVRRVITITGPWIPIEEVPNDSVNTYAWLDEQAWQKLDGPDADTNDKEAVLGLVQKLAEATE